MEALRTRLRHADSRKTSPSAAIVDTLGLLLAVVVVHSATVQDRAGIKLVGERIRGRFPRLKLIWADGAYEAAVGWAKQFVAWVLELVRKPDGRKWWPLRLRSCSAHFV